MPLDTCVVSGLFALRLSYYVSVAGLNLAPVLPILAGLGAFYPISPSRGLITLPHSSPGAMVIFSTLHLLLEPMSQFPQKSAWLLIGITLNL